MAESDKIKSDQIIDDALFEKAIANAEVFEDKIDGIVLGLKEIIAANSEFLKQNKNPEGTKAIKANTTAIIENEKARKALFMAEQQKQKLIQQEQKTAREARKETERRAKNTVKEAKAQANLNSAYKKASDRLRDLKKEMKDLFIQGRQNTTGFKILEKQFKELDGSVRAADQTVGDFQRNVGDYRGQFNGLGNSVNQITREMPAFAVSMQTGFLAISNNIPIFFDEMKRTNLELQKMQEQGKKTPTLFKAIASSIFSWGTALSIGVTLLTVFGKELVELIGTLGKADKAFKISAESQSKHWTTLREIYEERLDLRLRLSVAEGQITQDEADDFKRREANRKQLLELDKQFAAERKKIAKDLGVEESLITGELQETRTVGKGRGQREAEIEKNIALNEVFKQLERNYLQEVSDLKKKFELEDDAIAAERAANARKKEAKADEKALSGRSNSSRWGVSCRNTKCLLGKMNLTVPSELFRPGSCLRV